MFLALWVVGSLCRVHETVSTQPGQPSSHTRALGNTRSETEVPVGGAQAAAPARERSHLGTPAEGVCTGNGRAYTAFPRVPGVLGLLRAGGTEREPHGEQRPEGPPQTGAA